MSLNSEKALGLHAGPKTHKVSHYVVYGLYNTGSRAFSHLIDLDGSQGEHHSKVEVILGVGPVVREPGVDDGNVGAAGFAEHEVVRVAENSLQQLLAPGYSQQMTCTSCKPHLAGGRSEGQVQSSDQVLLAPLFPVEDGHLTVHTL